MLHQNRQQDINFHSWETYSDLAKCFNNNIWKCQFYTGVNLTHCKRLNVWRDSCHHHINWRLCSEVFLKVSLYLSIELLSFDNFSYSIEDYLLVHWYKQLFCRNIPIFNLFISSPWFLKCNQINSNIVSFLHFLWKVFYHSCLGHGLLTC